MTSLLADVQRGCSKSGLSGLSVLHMATLLARLQRGSQLRRWASTC